MPTQFTLETLFQDPGKEASLLAAIAQDPEEVYWQVMDLLPAAAFTEHREGFERLAEAVENGKPIPKVFPEAEPAPDPVTAAEELAGLYQKRLLAAVAQKFTEELYGDMKPGDLIAALEANLTKIQQAVRELRAGQVQALPELLPGLLQEVREKREAVKAGAIVGIPTGIKKLDKLLGGLQPGLHILAAEPGEGKTTLAEQMGASASREGFPVLFVSFEETLSKLALKAICAAAGLKAKDFQDGYGDPSELEEAAREHGPGLRNLSFVEGTSRLTVGGIKAKALQIMNRARQARCLIIVDYLQRWAASRQDSRGDFRFVVSALVSELRELSLRLDSPILVISSQNRSGQGKAEMVSLKESGDLEYSADTALFLVKNPKRTATPPGRAIDLTLDKNRYGDKGTVELIFRPDIGVFREVEKYR
jgi:replicative DNA helicase